MIGLRWSNSNFSIRAFPAYPLIGIRQTVPCRAIRADGISVNSTLPPFQVPLEPGAVPVRAGPLRPGGDRPLQGSERDKWGQHYWSHCKFHVFDSWVLPLAYCHIPKSARAYLFPQSVKINSSLLQRTPFSADPICPQPSSGNQVVACDFKSVKFITFAADPLVSTPFVRNRGTCGTSRRRWSTTWSATDSSWARFCYYYYYYLYCYYYYY